jgi:hypothetical protein
MKVGKPLALTAHVAFSLPNGVESAILSERGSEERIAKEYRRER